MSVKKPNSTEPTDVTIARYLRTILSALVCVYLFLILVLLPFYNQEGYNHIGSDKSYFFRTYTGYAAKVLIVALVPYWICRLVGFVRQTAGTSAGLRLKMAVRGLHLKLVDGFVIGYACAVVISYLASEYRETALWGTSGWYMGMLPQLMLVGIYFLVSRFVRRPVWMIRLAFAASAVVYVLGYLNRFDIWPIPMENSGLPEFISTVGNINWYCGYLAALFPLGLGMLVAGERPGRERVILGLYVFLGFLAIVSNGSGSILFALAILLYALYCLIGFREDPGMLRGFWIAVLLLGGAGTFTMVLRARFPGQMNLTYEVVNLMTWSALPRILLLAAAILLLLMCSQLRRLLAVHRVIARIALIVGPVCLIAGIGMIVWNTLHPGSLGKLSDISLFTFGQHWGSDRGATWELGMRCFLEQDTLHRLVGIGPDCMSDYLYGDQSAERYEMARLYFGDSRLTNAHNEAITMLANVGILGCVCYLGLLISACVRFLKNKSSGGIVLGAGCCVLAYLMNGVWSFQQSIGAATLFAVMGLGEAQARLATRD